MKKRRKLKSSAFDIVAVGLVAKKSCFFLRARRNVHQKILAGAWNVVAHVFRANRLSVCSCSRSFDTRHRYGGNKHSVLQKNGTITTKNEFYALA